MKDKEKNKVHEDAGAYERIALVDLRESKTNPRKDYDPVKLRELADSIKQKGILQPLVARAVKNKYEIVAGARRYRASRIAYEQDLTIEIPCIVKKLNDAEVIEIQVIENNQREDIPPLEEAEGYAALLALKDEKGENKYTVDSIALKVGKSDSYIRARLQLADLIPEAKKYLETGELYYTHARILSRLTQAQQKEALEYIFSDDRYSGVHKKYPCSIESLTGWVARTIETNLNNAVFPLDDAKLVKKAGACNVCSKNTACDGQLFPDYAKKKTCLDPVCFHNKTKQFELNRLNENLKKTTEDKDVILVSGYKYDDGTRKVGGVDTEVIGASRWKQCKKTDPGAKKAVLTSSREDGMKGKEIYVKISPKKKTDSSSSNGTSPEAEAKKRKLLQEKIEKINIIRLKIYEEICKAPSKLDGGDKREFIAFIADIMEYNILYDADLTLKFLGIPRSAKKATGILCKLTFEEAIKKIVLMALSKDVKLGEYRMKIHKSKEDSLISNAKRLKVNVAAIEKEFEEKAEAEKKLGKRTIEQLEKMKKAGKAKK